MGTNVSILIGRLTKDPEVRYTTANKPIAVASFMLAVDRYAKNGKETDFIRCKAFGKTAELLEKYAGKGKQICVTGEIHTADYEKDGKKVYMTEVVAKTIELLGSKSDAKEEEDEAPSGFSRLEDDLGIQF